MQPDFDPFTATFEEAQAASEGLPVSPPKPLMQFFAARQVDAYRAHVEKGDGFAVMRAVAECARCDLPLPDWLAVAFLTRFRAVAHLRVGSWDEAFGVPFPGGKQLAARRRRCEARLRVAQELMDFVERHPELSVDEVYAAASAKVRVDGFVADAINLAEQHARA